MAAKTATAVLAKQVNFGGNKTISLSVQAVFRISHSENHQFFSYLDDISIISYLYQKIKGFPEKSDERSEKRRIKKTAFSCGKGEKTTDFPQKSHAGFIRGCSFSFSCRFFYGIIHLWIIIFL
ncbi:MAG: hypothetical protein ACI3W6_09645 [Clostridia bacterium]